MQRRSRRHRTRLPARVYGEPYEKNGVTLIPAAKMAGGGGAGGGEDPSGGGSGGGGGFGIAAALWAHT